MPPQRLYKTHKLIAALTPAFCQKKSDTCLSLLHFESREKSGKFVNFERNLRQYIKVQNFQPETNIVDEQKYRTIVEVCCTGEALSYIHRLAAVTPRTHSFWTFEGLLHALRAHYTYVEEAAQARRALDHLKMTKMSVRTYIQKFNTLLDDVPNMSTPDVLYTFTKGLPEELQVWLRHDNPQTLPVRLHLLIGITFWHSRI